jgi:hypothetical protein
VIPGEQSLKQRLLRGASYRPDLERPKLCQCTPPWTRCRDLHLVELPAPEAWDVAARLRQREVAAPMQG